MTRYAHLNLVKGHLGLDHHIAKAMPATAMTVPISVLKGTLFWPSAALSMTPVTVAVVPPMLAPLSSDATT